MRQEDKAVVCVCSNGGHLVEMFEIIDCIKGRNIHFFTYKEESTKAIHNVHFFDNFAKSPLSFFFVVIKMLRLLIKVRPGIIVSTGAELAIPAFFISLVFPGVRRIYMECSAQVYTPSLTGRIVYPVSDLFIVQWKTLLVHYGKKAKYVGGLI